jgi:hypothetical protein
MYYGEKESQASRNYLTLIGYTEEKRGRYKDRWTERRMIRYIDK